jgi:hypothetical protein
MEGREMKETKWDTYLKLNKMKEIKNGSTVRFIECSVCKGYGVYSPEEGPGHVCPNCLGKGFIPKRSSVMVEGILGVCRVISKLFSFRLFIVVLIIILMFHMGKLRHEILLLETEIDSQRTIILQTQEQITEVWGMYITTEKKK